jgi:hypothetical protein
MRSLIPALLFASRIFAQDVIPGVSLAQPGGALTDTIVYARTITRSGVDTSAGTRTVFVSWAHDTLQVVQRFPGGGGEIVDTALADARTLRALAHRSHQPAKTMRFEFASEGAHGSVAWHDSTQTVHQATGGLIFDSNIIEMVVAALPLAPGYTVEVPFFIYERGGRVPMQVTVRDRSTVTFPSLGARDAWIVSVAVPGAPATVWVDTKTRAVLRVRYDIAARGMAFTDDRVTPLRS